MESLARPLPLYGRWSDGGTGLLVTGNVMVDRRYLERPGNIVIEGNGGLDGRRARSGASGRSTPKAKSHGSIGRSSR